MSKYSVELHYIAESGFDLGMKDYVCLSEDYRTALNNKILSHYWFDEIGFETAARFKHCLNARLNEIMPYYTKLLQSELITINPLLSFSKSSEKTRTMTTETTETKSENTAIDHDSTLTQNLDTTNTINNTATSAMTESQITGIDSTNNNTTNISKNIDYTDTEHQKTIGNDDMPQSLISDSDLTNEYYATSVSIGDRTLTRDQTDTQTQTDVQTQSQDTNLAIDNDTTTTSETSSVVDSTQTNVTATDETIDKTGSTNIDATTTDNYVITESGYNVPLSELILKYRETFMNVDLRIIADLRDLFMMVY